MAKRKNDIEIKPLESPISTTEEVVKIIEEEKEQVVEKQPIIKEKYKVILATPNYYIIDMKGVNVTVQCRNKYAKGDLVEY